MKALQIIGMCVAASVIYGIIHDQVTARVSIEYFTIGHPKVIDSTSPTLLGLVWGVIATFWAGGILGGLLALAARAGSLPKREPVVFVRPIVTLLVVMAVCATVAGLTGRVLTQYDLVDLMGPMAAEIRGDRHEAYITALWAHSTSYAVAFIGGGCLVLSTWLSRRLEYLSGVS